jgi:hypothetical protein
MQGGVHLWEATGFLVMSVEVRERHDGHHQPEHLKRAAHAIDSATDPFWWLNRWSGRRRPTRNKKPACRRSSSIETSAHRNAARSSATNSSAA